MKKLSLLATFMAVAVVVHAQTSQTSQAPTVTEGKPIAQALGWLIGEWEGEGVSPGEQEFIGKMSVTADLDDQALLMHRESLTTAGSPVGGKKEIMVIGLDGTTKNIIMTLNTSTNFIGIYSGELKTNELVFTLVTSQQGYVNRRVFKLLADGGLSFVIEGGTPEKPVSKLVEINFRKKS